MLIERKNEKKIKVSGGIWAGTFLLTLIYCIVRLTLPDGVEYRVWLRIAGAVWNFLVMPAALVMFLLFLIWGIAFKKDRAALRAGLTGMVSAASAVYAIVAVGGIFIFRLGLGEETKFAEGIIKTETEYLGSVASYTTYQEDIGLFLKKEYEPMSDILLLSLEMRYGEKFALVRGEGAWYQVYPASNPEVVFEAREMSGYFSDDYSIMRARRVMERKAAEICPERDFEIVYEEGYQTQKLASGVSMECRGAGDMEKCAKDIAALIAAVMEDDFFREPGRSVTLAVNCVDEEGRSRTAYFYFGNNRDSLAKYSYPMDFFTDTSIVYKELLYEYDALAGQAAEEAAKEGGTQESETERLQQEHEASPYFVEGAYKTLYEELFAAEGYPYEYDYNAKGNFYAWLCEGEGELENTPGTFTYMETVVYDRESKNGKCHLFVHYRTYYQDEAEYTTAILDMYAVDMETGQVYASGRHAWADVGNKEYCEATGEP